MNEFNFALLDSENTVVNIVVFDSENPDTELLENIKIQFNAVDAKNCSVYGEAYVGGKFVDGKFLKPQPYPSWVFNPETLEWEAPIGPAIDNIPCYWDEESVSWKPMVIIK